jgi:transposase
MAHRTPAPEGKFNTAQCPPDIAPYSLRLKRAHFLSFWFKHPVAHVLREACGSAHHFGRWLTSMGHRVTLLPAQYRRPCVRGNKTDAAD